MIGSRKYDFALEVTVADELYAVQGRFKVPKKAENLGFFSIGNKIPAGVELPVWVDPADRGRVEIDWKAASMAWAEAVELGNLTREQFETQVELELTHGRMDPADAAAARARLDA